MVQQQMEELLKKELEMQGQHRKIESLLREIDQAQKRVDDLENDSQLMKQEMLKKEYAIHSLDEVADLCIIMLHAQ